MLIPFIIQLLYIENNNTFLSSASVTVFVGILLVLTNLEENKKLNLQQAFLMTALAWLSIALFGCNFPLGLDSEDLPLERASRILPASSSLIELL